MENGIIYGINKMIANDIPIITDTTFIDLLLKTIIYINNKKQSAYDIPIKIWKLLSIF
ncbi:MAG: hypothetical protein U0J50_08390 [Peptacetobacter hiranonis]|uniref:Uncharacterized protein n=1 Tax=Peptacetobacter hiranonis (strain DSM 13275 / JCM 10541 / KCTC 15199 / TO-931) TaxID=500633 RepID=B6G222_PEPHT|nr:hypothetical protein CLOHIR_02184 [Peptacetobacter hiranonis DSM 13275]MED9948252.1 hypothetical protein [Peptacetobacter hiranonis]